MVRVCDGKTLPKGDPNAVYMLRAFGSQAHEIWNVADPANPVLVTQIGEASRTPTRVCGNATPALPFWCRARRTGAPGA